MTEPTVRALRIDVGQATDTGLVREQNEDALDTRAVAGVGVLLVVADGMGGHQAGEVASALAVQALSDAAARFEADASASVSAAAQVAALDGWLRGAVERANRAVWDAANRNAATHGMGTTLVCALVTDRGEAVVANVGDSRAYLVSAEGARLVTADHSWVAEQVKAGLMSQDEAEVSPYRHVLSRSLGIGPNVAVDVFAEVQLQPGDALVLCSDGISNYLELVDLPPILAHAGTAAEAAELLVQLALERGGADNATAVVARCLAP